MTTLALGRASLRDAPTVPTQRAQPARRGRVGAMSSPTHTSQLSGLMAQAAAGDQDAFARFYDLTSRVVFGIVLRVVRDRAQAEEVTQEVYLEAWQQAARFDGRQGTPSAWLNTIAHRRAVDRVRSSQRRIQRELRVAEAGPDQVVTDTSELVVAGDEGRRVREAMRTLTEVQRTALTLAYFEGRSHRDIAEALQVPLGTVKTRIRDAMKRLRTTLEEVSS
jgi:RNA polymerase sigma-70 factor, ECF subfamily